MVIHGRSSGNRRCVEGIRGRACRQRRQRNGAADGASAASYLITGILSGLPTGGPNRRVVALELVPSRPWFDYGRRGTQALTFLPLGDQRDTAVQRTERTASRDRPDPPYPKGRFGIAPLAWSRLGEVVDSVAKGTHPSKERAPAWQFHRADRKARATPPTVR